MSPIRKILVTGGAGYVGSILIPKLIRAGHSVRVLDLYLFGENLWPGLAGDERLEEIKGDIRHIQRIAALGAAGEPSF